jgi:hypothetical protein
LLPDNVGYLWREMDNYFPWHGKEFIQPLAEVFPATKIIDANQGHAIG